MKFNMYDDLISEPQRENIQWWGQIIFYVSVKKSIYNWKSVFDNEGGGGLIIWFPLLQFNEAEAGVTTKEIDNFKLYEV